MNLPPSSSFLDSVPLLLCEGDSDERFLNRIFNTRELRAQQVGGARNLRPAAAYLTQQNQLVFTIQDRDFRRYYLKQRSVIVRIMPIDILCGDDTN